MQSNYKLKTEVSKIRRQIYYRYCNRGIHLAGGSLQVYRYVVRCTLYIYSEYQPHTHTHKHTSLFARNKL